MRAAILLACAVSASASWTRKIQKRGGAARACQEEPSLTSVAKAFDGDECARILALFEEAKEEVDRRDAMGISRRNRWLPRDKWDSVRWVIARILKRLPELPQMDAEQFLARHVEFVLLHEFREGDFFDWHVDSKPDDGKMRTQNVNVVLSSATDFEGGALQVGSANASLQLGDLHAYPAALPHKVHDITKGRRYTLVVATRGTIEGYWAAALRDYERLARELGGEHPKLHWILGEHLESTDRPDDARRAFAASYRATPQKPQYARKFADDAAEKHAAGDLTGAAEDLGMATLVEPEDAEYRVDLGVVLWRLRDFVGAEEQLRAALERGAPAAAGHACLSLVLADAGDAAGAAAERDRAMAAGADDAAAAFEALEGLRGGGGT